ncbi:hypothetical protein ACIRL2_34675 [Embleya sp. NPDC127516]|uniref:hypothetical protein n=1 Tax=Embleya sp. NPDC127516 TaxID=3363990 RepID=UPI003823499F
MRLFILRQSCPMMRRGASVRTAELAQSRRMEFPLPDISLDYTELRKMASALTLLANTFRDDASKFRTHGSGVPGQHGTVPAKDIGGVAAPLGSFYTAWSFPMGKAVDGLEALSKLLGYVADGAEAWDDGVAAQFAATPGRNPLNRWLEQKKTWEEWLKTHPDGKPKEGETAPPQPSAEPPLHYTSTDKNGVTTEVTVKVDANYNVTEQTVTITDHGSTYTEHTTYGAGGAYDTVTTGRDGSVTTEKVTVDGSGRGTKTVTDKDGTTVYTTPNVNDPKAEWTKVVKDPPAHRPPIGGGRREM